MVSLSTRVLLTVVTAVSLTAACGSEAPTKPGTEPPADPGTEAGLYDRVIFSRFTPTELDPSGWAIWTMSTDGTDRRPLVEGLHYPESSGVSPDGRTVVFEDWGMLYLVDADGQHKRVLDTGLGYNLVPSWSPDGRWILFMAGDYPSSDSQVYRIHPEGGPAERLTLVSGQGARWPASSRDGRRLLFVAYDTASYRTWAVVRDLATGVETTVSDSNFRGAFPSWAPDGSSVLFLDSDPVTTTGWAAWRLDLRTNSYTYFGDSKGNRPLTYSPDGRTLLYGSGDLWLADSSGQNARILLADSTNNMEAYWAPASP